MTSAPALHVHDLGLRPFGEVYALQKQLVEQRLRGEAPDTLLLVEHPHALTVGRSGRTRRHVLHPQGLELFELERGGDVTYHGPGQLVAYPVIALGEGERDLHRYLRRLEEAVIRAVAPFGVEAGRRDGWTGVWVGETHKIASVGVAVRRWVTYHGVALNVATDLSYFRRINPCGLEASVMASLSSLGAPAPMPEVKQQLAVCMAASLERSTGEIPTV
jgi:lipoate-protein ligase B